jgi:lysozyme
MSYLQGIDISRHQGDVNHLEVAKSGMHFCIVKATEGRDYIDPMFAENIKKIREVASSGLTYFPGAYHFARPSSDGGGYQDGKAEAEDFCDAIQLHCGDIQHNFLPPALDFEEYSDDNATKNIPWIEGWIEVVENRLKRTPMIYTGANVWRYEVGNTDRFVDYPLWQVAYSESATAPPTTPWPTWTLWQWSGGGKFAYAPQVPGVGVVDVNRFKGSMDEFLAFANAKTEVVYPAPSGPVDIKSLEGSVNPLVARIQGLLLANGYGPSGLTGTNGRPDGKSGPKTQEALMNFKAKVGLPRDTICDWDTLWMLQWKY